ncbi:hypothetical protein [Pelagicoccus sp. SDUM812005]|uniref:hypothetical protein n=1 Tax=Pelagicoccus sp. SDUM812005 TaxID=3041257 RepID=UPI00280FDAE9|nr:hypothetical protein [Pelagicoccus sp. SDUM812005]MDQ8182055.1 hypothetical protein [Pelagicoccus sp. SDUM812005]
MKIQSKLFCGIVSVAATAALDAADLRSPFESLPAETVAAFRFDNSPETLDQYVENTKLGRLLFSDAKIAEYKDFIEDLIEAEDEEGNFLSKLGEVGLELDDLYEMVGSHFGAAVVQQEVPDHMAMPTFLVWAEMRDGVAERAFSAVLEGSTENENIERTDLELPGGPGARIKNLTDGSSFLVAQLENRFFFAIGNVMEPITSMEEAKVFENAELEALGRFLAAQQEGGGDFLSTFYADSGVSAVRPDYPTRLEVLGDVKTLFGFLPPQNRQAFEMMEFDAFTKLGIWSGFVDMQERSTIFLGAPAPRSGIATLLENEFFEFQPPMWVPSNVNAYTVASFDMNKLYAFAIDMAKKFMPPEQVEQQVAMANGQLQMMLQADIPTLMSAFGKRIHVLEYPMEVVTMDNPDGISVDLPRASQAMVMDFTRPEILQAGMAMMAGMAQNPESGMELVDEQGFSGIRTSDPTQGVITIAHGKGKLVFAVGSEETSSRIFSTLTNLPEGEAALANSSEFRSFIAEANVKPGTLFSYSRGEEILKSLVPVFKSLANTMRMTAGEDAAELMERAIGLFPSEEELDGLLGVTFSRMYHNESGIILEGSNQYK